jgi:hypothetical protein
MARQCLLLASLSLLVLATGHLLFHYLLFTEQLVHRIFF